MFIPEIAAREFKIRWHMNASGCFHDHLSRLMLFQRGQLGFSPPSKSTSVRHTHDPSMHTSIYPIHGTKSDLRLLRSGSFFFSPKSFIPLFSFFPSTLRLLLFTSGGFCVVNGGESWRDEKGRDATLGKLSVKDRGRDGWRGWVHERMTEGRKELWAKTKYVEQCDTGRKNKEWSDQ